MTDGRIPGKWVSEPRFAEMPDATFGFLARAIAWSNEAGTDGHIKRRYLANLHSTGEQQPQVYAQLEAAGLWKKTADGYQFIGWDKKAHQGGLGQELAENVRSYKDRKRVNQQRYRDKLASADGGHVTGHVTDSVADHVGQDTTGHDRLITGEVSESETSAVSSDDLLVEIDDMTVNPRTGEVVEPLPAGSPMAVAAQIRSELRQQPDPDYCAPPGCGRTLVNGVCPKCSKAKEKAA